MSHLPLVPWFTCSAWLRLAHPRLRLKQQYLRSKDEMKAPRVMCQRRQAQNDTPPVQRLRSMCVNFEEGFALAMTGILVGGVGHPPTE